MPQCPKCSRVYADGKLKFCTNDGARLLLADASAIAFEQNSVVGARRTPPGELLSETVILAKSAARQNAAAPVLPAAEKTLAALEINGRRDSNGAIAATQTADFDISAQATLHGNLKPAKISDPPPDAPPNKEPSQQKSVVVADDETPPTKSGLPFIAVCVAGALLLFAALAVATGYFSANQSVEPSRTAAGNVAPVAAVAPPQTFAPPKDAALPTRFVEFENKKGVLSGKLADKFVPFSLAFPARWKKSGDAAANAAGNFLDVGDWSADNLPLEQLLVSWYDSRGTFAADQAAFPVLTEKYAAKYSNRETGIPAYHQISAGAIKLNGRDAYEFRFEGEAVDGGGAPIKIWGRTVFLPVGRDGATSGLTLTMLATSLAPNLRGAQDVGEKGDLAQVIKTFKFKE